MCLFVSLCVCVFFVCGILIHWNAECCNDSASLIVIVVAVMMMELVMKMMIVLVMMMMIVLVMMMNTYIEVTNVFLSIWSPTGLFK